MLMALHDDKKCQLSLFILKVQQWLAHHSKWFSIPKLLAVVLIASPVTLCAWDAHILLTHIALKNMAEVSKDPTIPAETLESFLQSERKGLSKLLALNETWSRIAIPVYPGLPDALKFTETGAAEPIQIQFSKAIRINPALKLPLFVQYAPGEAHRIHKSPLNNSQVMLSNVAQSDWTIVANPPLESIVAGELVSPFEILTTASDEPDYGMDMDLWDDSPGDLGKIYQWGTQPFGKKEFILGSQAPFHMGLFFESSIVYMLTEFKHCYSEYRIHLYLHLSRYAFKTKHPYWGYRFLGWAIHYAQDLSQPYHTTSAPGTSTTKEMFIGMLTMIGIDSPERNLLQLLTNRHSSFENYEYHAIIAILQRNIQTSLLAQALSDLGNDKAYPLYSDSYPREIIAKESNALANSLDASIIKAFPPLYVMDPNYIFFTTEPLPPQFV